MRRMVVACAAVAAMGFSSQAHAIGCVSGAVAGGVAGHYAHHHAVIGAIGGCIAGHHIAKERKLEKERQMQQAKAHHTTEPAGSTQ